MGPNEILRHCVLDHKWPLILNKSHAGVAGGQYAGKAMMHNILQAWLWWPTMYTDAQDYCHSCYVCQRTRNPSWHDNIWLVLQLTLKTFDKWTIDFVGPINPTGMYNGACYIIIVTDYLRRWDEVVQVKDCTSMIAANFLFENVITQFGCPNILVSDQGTHFVNQLIA